MFNNIRNNTAEQRRPRPQQQRIPIVHRRVPAQQQNRAPGYTPRRPSSPTTSKAEALKLSRGRTVSRQHQRPWTLKEWAFVERIPKDIDMEAMKELMLKGG
ncbi:hypothetical protein N431DRAFT_31752 [Stipitochalara longipes BDJ]|nr:hypothetical protein N431DRAFT_31752 [Stipitochalara longipes BDJ]